MLQCELRVTSVSIVFCTEIDKLAISLETYACMVIVTRYVLFYENNTSLYVAGMGEKRNMYRLLVGKPEGKRPLGRPRRRWIFYNMFVGW
jgi:hypothetical protein